MPAVPKVVRKQMIIYRFDMCIKLFLLVLLKACFPLFHCFVLPKRFRTTGFGNCGRKVAEIMELSFGNSKLELRDFG